MPKKKPKPPEPKVREFETFHSLDSLDLDRLRVPEPTVFNCWVRVERYKVTIERIEEPKEVLAQRLADLYKKTDNHHHWLPLRQEAARLGVADLYENLIHAHRTVL